MAKVRRLALATAKEVWRPAEKQDPRRPVAVEMKEADNRESPRWNSEEWNPQWNSGNWKSWWSSGGQRWNHWNLRRSTGGHCGSRKNPRQSSETWHRSQKNPWGSNRSCPGDSWTTGFSDAQTVDERTAATAIVIDVRTPASAEEGIGVAAAAADKDLEAPTPVAGRDVEAPASDEGKEATRCCRLLRGSRLRLGADSSALGRLEAWSAAGSCTDGVGGITLCCSPQEGTEGVVKHSGKFWTRGGREMAGNEEVAQEA
ncbi:uncharacterized protein LOC124864846 [Girardinichthys multiradiatus]|uniref:uncharacterized protein LOC124863021 n=1 Tax=Girardinichthys multiradiatus TaxID=208333 RepID=UPI001FABD56B|nr:uncharacterized protein LOC124863021 [Girardinichthys multiradiatus]XP_047215739.1 uncharacterized protein LOC124864846 [Girardinichthys multiradiatus]